MASVLATNLRAIQMCAPRAMKTRGVAVRMTSSRNARCRSSVHWARARLSIAGAHLGRTAAQMPKSKNRWFSTQARRAERSMNSQAHACNAWLITFAQGRSRLCRALRRRITARVARDTRTRLHSGPVRCIRVLQAPTHEGSRGCNIARASPVTRARTQ